MRVLTLSSLLFSSLAAAAIDRVAVVSRHAPASAAPNASALDLAYGTFTVGNGAFAFNVDCTGLQTLNESYGLGVNTLSDWGYHTAPFAPGDATAALRNFNYTWYSTPTDGHGGSRRIPTFNSGNSTSAVVNWLMSNPHRLNLGQLSLRLALPGGATEAVQLHAVTAPSQRVDIYAGAIDSNFTLTWPGGGACALVDDNDDAALSCAPGGVISALWASYGRPSGSCAAGFVANPACASANSSAVLGTRCIGRASCSIHVDFLAGWGDPCPRQAKWLAVNWTCSGPPPPPPPPPVPVRVRTVVDPDVDLVSVQLECPDGGAAACPLALRLAFAYGTTASSGADWTQPDAHTTTVLRNDSAGVTLLRVLDGDAYRVDCAWSGGLVLVQAAPHVFDLIPPPSDNGGGHSAPAWPRASVSCLFSPGDAAGEVRFPVGASQDWLVAKADLTRALLTRALPLPLFPLVSAAASVAWAAFWQGGAFVDLASNTDDPVAFELERRVVLSRYLMRANNAGAEPPQETGCVRNHSASANARAAAPSSTTQPRPCSPRARPHPPPYLACVDC